MNSRTIISPLLLSAEPPNPSPSPKPLFISPPFNPLSLEPPLLHVLLSLPLASPLLRLQILAWHLREPAVSGIQSYPLFRSPQRSALPQLPILSSPFITHPFRQPLSPEPHLPSAPILSSPALPDNDCVPVLHSEAGRHVGRQLRVPLLIPAPNGYNKESVPIITNKPYFYPTP